MERRDAFVCRSNCGCGGAGNRCRIERLRTLVAAQRSSFTWGGGCSLHDKGTRKRKLPDLAPDPFREREELLQQIVEPFRITRQKPRVALSDEFLLKGLFPFFTAFLHEAGFDLEIIGNADAATLKRGIQSATVPFCAPMQLFHGVAERMAETGADWLFVPMIRSVPRVRGQRCAVVCPIAQAGSDVLRWAVPSPLLSPIIEFGVENLESKEFLASCKRLASEIWVLFVRNGVRHGSKASPPNARLTMVACKSGAGLCCSVRHKASCPVVVLGRNYTIYNKVLNSNVPAILREQGAIGIPLDCYPLDAEPRCSRTCTGATFMPFYEPRTRCGASRGFMPSTAATIPAAPIVSTCILPLMSWPANLSQSSRRTAIPATPEPERGWRRFSIASKRIAGRRVRMLV